MNESLKGINEYLYRAFGEVINMENKDIKAIATVISIQENEQERFYLVNREGTAQDTELIKIDRPVDYSVLVDAFQAQHTLKEIREYTKN